MSQHYLFCTHLCETTLQCHIIYFVQISVKPLYNVTTISILYKSVWNHFTISQQYLFCTSLCGTTLQCHNNIYFVQIFVRPLYNVTTPSISFKHLWDQCHVIINYILYYQYHARYFYVYSWSLIGKKKNITELINKPRLIRGKKKWHNQSVQIILLFSFNFIFFLCRMHKHCTTTAQQSLGMW